MALPTGDSQLLITKLFIPAIRSQLVSRQRLIDLLEQGLERKLTLVCAQAGFGKTTLVVQWHLSNPHQPLAWVSLDTADNEPLRFLRYLVAAFEKFIPQEAAAILNQLNSVQPVAVETILTDLINALTNLITSQKLARLYLVLDDYHFIQNQEINRTVAFLLDHMPPQLHLVITSRLDPLLPLARLRARDQVTEIRASELRFQVDETTAFVDQDNNLKSALGLEEITQLTMRTDGWAVGLQLAVLWLKSRNNKVEGLKNFTGNNRFVLEYLAEEVLSRQPEPRQTFLLETSLLDRFNASLASAVTGQECNIEDLQQLEQSNLFLVPLDDEGEWYRYHHLFAEFLQYRLRLGAAEHLNEIHLRASRWFEQNGLLHEAIEHSLVAADYHLAARLIEPIARPLVFRGEYVMLDNWVARIPEPVIYDYPELCLYTCYSRVLRMIFTGFEKLLQAAEDGIKSTGDKTKLFRLLLFEVQYARAKNNREETFRYAEQVQPLIPAGDTSSRLIIEVAKIQVFLNHGEANKANASFKALLLDLQKENNIFTGYLAMFSLASVYLLQGQLQAAMQAYKRTLELDPTPNLATITRLRIGNIYLEWNELEPAENFLRQVEEVARQVKAPYGMAGQFIYGGLWWPDGDQHPTLDWSTATDEQIEQYWQKNYQAQLNAFRNRFDRKRVERIAVLEEWCVRTFPGGYSALPKPLDYQREPQYLALARVLIYQNNFEEAITFLQELRQLAQSQGRVHDEIKYLILLALGYQAAGKSAQQNNFQAGLALKFLREALSLAENGNYRLVFVEEGDSLQNLLSQLLPILNKEDQKLASYIHKLLAVSGAARIGDTKALTEPITRLEIPVKNHERTIENNQKLVEPLSEREFDVLRLIANGASNQEISAQLVVTLSTVKKHSSSIFSKLGVSNRTQALIRARDLNLL